MNSCMNYVIKLGSQFKKRFKQLAKKYHNIVDDLEELKLPYSPSTTKATVRALRLKKLQS